MTKPTGKKIKGNKDDAKHFIEFFDNEFFGIIDDDNKKTTNQTISLTVPIDEGTTQKNKSNLLNTKCPRSKTSLILKPSSSQSFSLETAFSSTKLTELTLIV